MDSADKHVADNEQDHRFPSGAWRGFFLQPVLSGKHWMELDLTFRAGTLTGDGRDWVGRFVFRGRYDVESGKCWWTKQYVGRHAVAYEGYNEGKGIWGIWTWPDAPPGRGGFHIWPVALGDPTGVTLKEALEAPVQAEMETREMPELAPA